MHKPEIKRLQAQLEEKGLTLVPLALYFRNGKVKVELGLARGKRTTTSATSSRSDAPSGSCAGS
jgi:SsrA-binding protein